MATIEINERARKDIGHLPGPVLDGNLPVVGVVQQIPDAQIEEAGDTLIL
jgi:hypothetical protein